MQIPLSKEATHAAPRYLDGFTTARKKTGEELFEQSAARDFEWLSPDDAFLATVDDKGTEFEVDLLFEKAKWVGECTCEAKSNCEHCYAAMSAALAANRRVLSVAPRPSTQAKAVPSESTEVSAFAEELAVKIGRKLDRAEIRVARAIEELRERQSTGVVPENQLHFLLGGQSNWSWERHTLWPEQPKSTWDAWLYIADFLRQRRKSAPPFLTEITKEEAIEELLVPWRRQKQVIEWTHWLESRTRHPQSAAETAPIELRVIFLKEGMQVETYVASEAAWKPMKKGRWSDLNRTNSGYEVPMNDESLLIWSAMHTGWSDEPLTRYTGQQAQETARKLLQSSLLKDRVLTAAGVPFRRAEEKIQWRVDTAETALQDYVFRLELPSGDRLPHPLVVLPGDPVLFLTVDTIYEAPPFAETVKRHADKLTIPAPALESAAGVAMLERARLPLPPRLTDRVTVRRPRIVLRCALRDESGGETFELQMLARWSHGAGDEAYTGDGWEFDLAEPEEGTAEHESAPAIGSANEKKRIIHWERAPLRTVPALLEGMPLRWSAENERWEGKVSRKFPQQFGDWLASLPANAELELDPLLATLREAPLSASLKLDVEPVGTDWFDLRVALDVPDVEFTKDELEALLSARGGWVRLGKRGWRKLNLQLTPEEDAALADLGLSSADLTSSEPQRLHALQLGHQKASRLLSEERVTELQIRAEELRARVTPPLPTAISAELRPYQLEGFYFLAYLSTNGFGGLLADDMGLGKTLQTLTWLCWLRELPGYTGGQSLVVCPKSVMDNWSSEATRFLTNGLRVRLWRSTDRGRVLDAVKECDLLVINYAQLRVLAADLGKMRWHALILDEAQAIKNPDSQTAKTACGLESDHRLALTGTPIENRLLDLWSIMNFAMPGVLGVRSRFAKLYDQKQDGLARRRLAGRVRPFVLRRTKEQVAKDLPARIEEDILCEMEGKQATLYSAELKRARQALLKLKTEKDLDKARFSILTSLLRLRQICCHPLLVDAGATDAPSAKVEGLIDLLEPLLEEGRKVLVFSQFVGVLELLQKEIIAREWKHFILTGQTENRGALIEDFQSSEGASVFLLSLKASGFGLNLTAASYVVLFDPWWNPAVENQAIDRAHRIGQKDTVFAYRLLVKGSIEEKIRALQTQKRELATDVLGEEAFAKALTLDDLRTLLEEPTDPAEKKV